MKLVNSSLNKFIAIGLSLQIMLFTTGCSLTPGQKLSETQLFAMDTVMDIQIAGDEALLTEAEQKIRGLEDMLSVTKETSEIYQVNANGSASVSKETYDIVTRALNMCDRTGGALDITIYPVLKAWGFTGDEYRVPAEAELQELLQNVDFSRVVATEQTSAETISPANSSTNSETIAPANSQINSSTTDSSTYTISIPAGYQIDLGSVVKGYTGTMLADYFKANGVTSGLINLGGNVQCIGNKPDGKPWKVAIKSPFEDSKTGVFGVIDATDEAIVTSGGYERYFEQDGETYWHILDPSTGKPAKNGLVSVTIVGKDGLVCDALSTALFVMGYPAAIDYYRDFPDFDAVFITEDGKAYITPGLEDRFSLSSEYYSTSIYIIS
ncbi:FAD:protein FMN transferase [Butyrivibrio proteoclasticus]|uniref:FAD:protein FMN transferase n=1 Tax=Butyrivibrio proteoclasticus TaxID=43305 RepID=UPI000479A738|nr:FAD:protein FMN transferase [Butyrivibrio proteoclasticus]